ncbi:hypothetical protein JHK82_042279 [Glycine max]|uniref:Uncharacterized protein n=2 Tax=Glycine subgen. Soja TaxID=1462606 RepID=K7MBA2_SOYBN|nr:hypothetical protein JHK86_042322 [Glycine max]RZB64566.1 ERAD-associated E3 ubiquitin-protein ligase component HRD3A [Glycine soja]KAG5105309.1 hypothetical protein JHK82_042279 [Glycine max]KAG5116432.1 hypothetical protein JHK84_042545 [Glycine max]KAH1147112.1 hypothetical protein GYH30_042327 [Glycine max]
MSHTLSLSGDVRIVDLYTDTQNIAESGHPAVQLVLGFLWEMGLFREQIKGKAFRYHHFTAEGGNMQSKMELVYNYTRSDHSCPPATSRAPPATALSA